ncbi:uncharacterized protein LOC110023060 isoform X2 [Phalaenopsis equestris]|uniref:uncharacterized protein LOC110023060 isoform X2 n=1 Tax=Phalaenopsis equestris TaxID=78828 RepID=UPI0009E3564A|nr:uncharacterized protein LOC110023060 isoform X2 [Phalaenopsis equestris]
MSFLAGRLAAKEGSFFLQESKLAAGRLAEKLTPSTSGESCSNTSTVVIEESANILPEILRHSIPIKANTAAVAEPSLSTASKWLLKDSRHSPSSSITSDDLNPLRAYVSLPQATFGPRRWEIPNEQTTFLASTANELRRDRYSAINPDKLKEVAKGYSEIGKAFAAATIIVFGGATTLLVYTARKLRIESADDIRSKGRELIQPRVDTIREQLAPLRSWVEKITEKWHVHGEGKIKEKPIVKEFSKVFSSNSSN